MRLQGLAGVLVFSLVACLAPFGFNYGSESFVKLRCLVALLGVFLLFPLSANSSGHQFEGTVVYQQHYGSKPHTTTFSLTAFHNETDTLLVLSSDAAQLVILRTGDSLTYWSKGALGPMGALKSSAEQRSASAITSDFLPAERARYVQLFPKIMPDKYRELPETTDNRGRWVSYEFLHPSNFGPNCKPINKYLYAGTKLVEFLAVNLCSTEDPNQAPEAITATRNVFTYDDSQYGDVPTGMVMEAWFSPTVRSHSVVTSTTITGPWDGADVTALARTYSAGLTINRWPTADFGEDPSAFTYRGVQVGILVVLIALTSSIWMWRRRAARNPAA